ncbi:hypothetical protein DPF_1427 [Desulfoplanes formicivorans]|uniref:Uncharacterized protein n=1 Tax=Desulfoplanes formicivorans TaxID=1592317 RepID=A0A194AI13_9BACT|nr:hypothetical protein DPF_1427 [Desulfoplanes formicivorans]
MILHESDGFEGEDGLEADTLQRPFTPKVGGMQRRDGPDFGLAEVSA